MLKVIYLSKINTVHLSMYLRFTMAGEWTKNQSILLTHRQFSQMKKGVWNVSFALPESIRKKCDDDGAYGYFIEFKKVNGKTVLYNFTSLFDSLPDGTLACKAANEFMLQK
ncbi:maltose transporter permease [Klebsiella pneumoniae]|uniref:maltose transporter permease n=1 Tax=Klebsiella pneumoniae TaxID=573 RepID=UPI0028446FA8|nr:maltose transporter permease [Klebsiella pneumoniae]MDR4849404.1 maltose transporter permease [Klebsiella pneumoniae]